MIRLFLPLLSTALIKKNTLKLMFKKKQYLISKKYANFFFYQEFKNFAGYTLNAWKVSVMRDRAVKVKIKTSRGHTPRSCFFYRRTRRLAGVAKVAALFKKQFLLFRRSTRIGVIFTKTYRLEFFTYPTGRMRLSRVWNARLIMRATLDVLKILARYILTWKAAQS